MTKICTDIKQSKKLIELGIDVSTSDCSWILHPASPSVRRGLAKSNNESYRTIKE